MTAAKPVLARPYTTSVQQWKRLPARHHTPICQQALCRCGEGSKRVGGGAHALLTEELAGAVGLQQELAAAQVCQLGHVHQQPGHAAR